MKATKCFICYSRIGKFDCPRFEKKICSRCCGAERSNKECKIDCKKYPKSPEPQFGIQQGQVLSWETGDLDLCSDYLFLPDLYEHVSFELLEYNLSYENPQTLNLFAKFVLKKEFATAGENILCKEIWKSEYYPKYMDDEILYPIIGVAAPGKGLFSLNEVNLIYRHSPMFKASVTNNIIIPPNQRGLDPISTKNRESVNYLYVRNLFLYSKISFGTHYFLNLRLYGINELNTQQKILNTKIGLLIPFGKSKLINPSISNNQYFNSTISVNTFKPIKTKFYPGEQVGSFVGLPLRGNQKIIEGNMLNVSYPCDLNEGPVISLCEIDNKIQNHLTVSILNHDRFVNPILLPTLRQFYGNIALPVHINVINIEKGIKNIEVRSTDLKSGNYSLENFTIDGESEMNIPLLFPGLLNSFSSINSVKIDVYERNQIIYSDTVKIEILPKIDLLLRVHDVGHDWFRDTLEAIACWVTPNNKKVEDLVNDAKSRIKKSVFNSTSPDSYIKAVWDELKFRRIKSDGAPISIGNSIRANYQPINPPESTLDKNSGNCIELVLVFASALEKLSLESLIILIDGHAFLGWETNGTLSFLETTLIDSNTFDKALELGKERYQQTNQQKKWKKELKISKLRGDGFKPLF